MPVFGKLILGLGQVGGSSSVPGPLFMLTHSSVQSDFSSAGTFTGIDFGSAHANRWLAIAVSAVLPSNRVGSVGTLGCTAGGVTLKKIANALSGRAGTAIFYGHVPTGATGTIVVSGAAEQRSIAVYRAISPASVIVDAYRFGTTEALSTTVPGGFDTTAVTTRQSTSHDTSIAGVEMQATNVSAGAEHRASHGYGRPAAGALRTISNVAADRMSVASFRRARPLNLVIFTQDVSHAAATNTQVDLEDMGHTVTLVADSAIGSTNVSAYDVVLAARVTGTTTAADGTVSAALRAMLDAGKPLVIGGTFQAGTAGTGRSAVSTLLDLTGTCRIIDNTTGLTDIVVADNEHPITEGLDETTIAAYLAANFRWSVTAGQSIVGTPLMAGVSGMAGEHALIAIEQGATDLDAATVNARVVCGDFPYGGQSRLSALARTMLSRSVLWAAGEI